uniref:helix-turn-helix domain-containing protein n=1 Tax=Amycolatopsis sp. CA-096443 TaxID=3239919 RepID=UPI003F493F89
MDRMFSGADATALREAMGCTAREFAEMIGVSVGSVNTWSRLRGGAEPGPDNQAALATLLARQNAAVRAQFHARGGPVLPEAASAEAGADADDSAEEAVALADRVAGLVGDGSLADRLEIELSGLAVAYVHEPLPEVYQGLRAVQRELNRALAVPRRPAGQSRLLWLAAVAGVLLAHACQNLGRSGAALKHAFAARTLADAVDSDALRAATHATTALLLEWSPQPSRAVDEARRGLACPAGVQTRRRLLAVAARAAARVGDAETAREMLRLIESGREPGMPRADAVVDVGGLLSFPSAKLQYYIGGAYQLIGEHDLAVRHSGLAVDAYVRGPDHDRSYGDLALARLVSADARLQLGDAAGAGADVAAALARPDGTPLPEGQRITQFGSALADLHRRALQLQRRGVPDAAAVAGQLTLHVPPAPGGLLSARA